MSNDDDLPLFFIAPRGFTFAPNVDAETYGAPPPLIEPPPSTLFPAAPNDLTPSPTSPSRRTSHARKKPDDWIPRPPNAFILFRSEMVDQFIKSQHVPGDVEANHGNLSKIIGLCWRNLPFPERSVWEHKARLAQAAHKAQYPHYRFRPHAAKPARRRVKEPPRPPDARRVACIAGLLVEGVKGARLAKVVRKMDEERGGPGGEMRFDEPVTAAWFGGREVEPEEQMQMQIQTQQMCWRKEEEKVQQPTPAPTPSPPPAHTAPSPSPSSSLPPSPSHPTDTPHTLVHTDPDPFPLGTFPHWAPSNTDVDADTLLPAWSPAWSTDAVMSPCDTPGPASMFAAPGEGVAWPLYTPTDLHAYTHERALAAGMFAYTSYPATTPTSTTPSPTTYHNAFAPDMLCLPPPPYGDADADADVDGGLAPGYGEDKLGGECEGYAMMGYVGEFGF